MSPLAGIRVLDFSWVLAGPYATRLLADQGADVIKVQTDRRLTGYVNDAYFTTWNRSKRGITLDLSIAEGRDLARRLVDLVDVVVDNFSARVMGQWGLDDATLKAIRPDLVVAHLTGMGHSGPQQHYVSYGPTAQSLTGLTALTAYDDRPVGFGYSFSDHVAGLAVATAILIALDHRDRTGEGSIIDGSQLESTAAFMGPAYLEAASGQQPAPSGAAGMYLCRDGRWIAVEPAGDRAVWAAGIDAAEAVEQLQHQGIAASIVASAADLIEDPQLVAQGFWTGADHSTLGWTTFDRSVIQLKGTPAPKPSPLLGQHNDNVYGELLGLSVGERRRLAEVGAFR